jgi:hypothetical protein
MLQMAVHPLQELCQVNATTALLKVHTKKDLDYEAYSSLLVFTASDYDSKHGVSKSKRQVYAHDLDHGDEDLYDASYEMDPFDIDTPVDTIQAFASKFTPRRGMNDKVHMPRDKWFGLDQKTKDLWDQIDDKYKSVILGYTKSSSPSPFSSKLPSKSPFPNKPHCNINLHEMSAYEFLQVYSHELEPDPEPDEAIPEDLPAEQAEPEPDTLLISKGESS